MPGTPSAPTCSSCELRRFCAASRRASPDDADAFVTVRHKVAKGQVLYRAGDAAMALYAIRTGVFKTVTYLRDGTARIGGFLTAGDVLGLDGLGSRVHGLEAVALEDSQLCVVPHDRLEAATMSGRELMREFHRIVRDELVRDHRQMALLSGASADARLATFLVEMTRRNARLGFSSTSLVLRMTRQDIGVHLGMKLETVSRGLGRLQAMGLLQVRHRDLTVLKPVELAALAECGGDGPLEPASGLDEP